MPTSPLTSPRFPSYQGFTPLANQGNDSRSYHSQMDHEEGDIPLAPIRSNASFGARKANQGGVGPEIERMRSNNDMPGTSGGSSSTDEKNGLFKYRSGPIGRRRLKRNEPDPVKRRGTDTEVALNFMGRMYSNLVAKSVLTRYLIYIIPVAFLLAIPLVILPITGNANTIPLGSHVTNSTADPPTKEYGPPLFHLFIWFEASWAGLWAGKVVAHFIPIVFVFFCGVISSGTRKYATVLRGLEIPLSLFFWALVTWLVFRFLFTNSNITWIYALTNIFGALFVSSAVFLGERAIIHLMSISYHARSFSNRIKESKRDIYLLGLMYDASRALFPMYCEEFADEDYVINDSIEAMLGRRGGAKNKANAGAPMRLIGNVGRFGDKVTSVFGNLASEITGKQVFNPNSAHSIVVEALEKTRSSEALARRIWMSFVVEDNDALYPEDIAEVLGPTHKEDAEECFVAIDADANGDISLDEMVRKVVQIGKERKAMANSLKDISEALAAFDKVLLFLVLLLVIFIFLAFFQSSFITTLATAGTALLSLSFVFAVTTQEILGSCIFLFVKHPYDVGDRVDIQGPEKMNLIVEKISLLYTVFMRIDKMQVVQVPNITLNALWIENVSRSKAMRETIDVNVSYDTSFEDIELLRVEMEKFVQHPDNSRDFQPDVAFSVAGVGDCDKLQLKVAIKHKSNWHNDIVRATRRSKFMCALALALKKVPIFGPGGGGDAAGSPQNPTYSVSVTDEFASTARTQSAEAKNLARLVPHHTDADDGGSQHSSSKSAEKRAVNELNTRNPLVDNDDYTLHNGSRESSLERERQDNFATSTSYLHPSASLSQTAASRSRQRGASSASRTTTDAEAIRNDLLKSQSQKGRRQAGQGLPPMHLGGDLPPADITRYASMSSSQRRNMSFDVERGSAPGPSGAGAVVDPMGSTSLYPTNSAASNNPYMNPPPGANAAMGYSVYAAATGTDPAYPSGATPANPVQNASTASSGRSGNNPSNAPRYPGQLQQ
ncbi:hypothetical protein SBRCBS47491_006672 [Sporothrix bragantina]|uniref:EF-hand domain-containing protein n=1 Tax=Sporothrix bragantina TaxID=671064 RepID=A0ABP0C876_9PEZI